MRISSSTIFDRGTGSMQDLQAQMSRTQQQLSSGRRILTPSDDPISASQAVDVGRMLAQSQQQSEVSAAAGNTLALEESLLGSAEQTVQDLQGVAVQAGDAALSSADRKALAYKVRSDYAQLLSLANWRGEDGQYVFSGYRGNSQPFSEYSAGTVRYLGDQGQRLVQVAGGRQIAVNDAGDTVFSLIRDGNGTFATGTGAANAGSGTIDGGNVLDQSAWDSGKQDFTIRFYQTATVAPDAGNAPGGATVQAAVSDAAAWAAGSKNYTVTFTGATAVTISDGTSSQNFSSASGPWGARFKGVDFAFTGNGNNGDTYAVTQSANAPVTYDIIEHDAALGTYTSKLSGLVGAGGALPQWSPSARAYASGSVIALKSQGAEPAFDTGSEVHIEGTPAAGDQFTVEASTNVDIFKTANDFASALENGLSGAALTNELNVAMRNLGNALDNVLAVRASVGLRMKDLDQLKGLADDLANQQQQNLSRLQDVDYAKAASDLASQQLQLQAAQKSFKIVTANSLFDLL